VILNIFTFCTNFEGEIKQMRKERLVILLLLLFPLQFASSLREVLLNLTNKERIKRGIPPLILDPILSNIAQHHSEEMAKYEKVSHISPVYGYDLKKRVGYTFPLLKPLGENVASGRSIPEIHRLFMESLGHRRNILNPKFSRIGIGIAKRGRFVIYVTEIFSGNIPKWMVAKNPRYYFDLPPTRKHPEVFTPPESEVFIFTQPEEEKLVVEGMDLYQQGKYAEAIKCFKRAISVNPNYIYAYYDLGLVYYQLSDYRDALHSFKEVLRRREDDLYSRYYLGATYYHLGEYRRAITQFLSLTKVDYSLHPDVNGAELKIGSLYFLALSLDQLGKKKGRFITTVGFLKRRRKVTPTLPSK